MKKILLMAVVVVAMASCKKDYTCECSTTNNGVTTSAQTTITDTESNAKEACEAGSMTSGGITVTCKIK